MTVLWRVTFSNHNGLHKYKYYKSYKWAKKYFDKCSIGEWDDIYLTLDPREFVYPDAFWQSIVDKYAA